MARIITEKQKICLDLIADTKIAEEFYLSGGTALSYFFLKHRSSEDLDFFNFSDFDVNNVSISIKTLQKDLGYTSFDFQNSMNRNLFFLRFSDTYVLKLEFTYYPFQQIEEPKKIRGVLIDSLVDIATNKLFTIAQNPRGRDYFDLFMIIQEKGYSVEQLRMLAKQKFDWHVDPLQLATQFDKVDQFLDDPLLTREVKLKNFQKYFQKYAAEMRDQIIA
jgi:predicted nucleotidyltransferase component of viral defense system